VELKPVELKKLEDELRRLNRTKVELKQGYACRARGCRAKFESNQSGIETQRADY